MWIGMCTEPSTMPYGDRPARSAKVTLGKEAGASPSRIQSAGPPLAAAAGRTMPTPANSRWAAASCSTDSASSVTGLPHGINQAG